MTLNASAARSASVFTLPVEGALFITAIKISADSSLLFLLLIDPPSLVGSGVEIASYREGGSPLLPWERHHDTRAGRGLGWDLIDAPHGGPAIAPGDDKRPSTHPHERDHVRRAIPH